ncbi:MAG: ligase-associated DNA damage response endonuclease PdeM [Pseudomonadota bacterium]
MNVGADIGGVELGLGSAQLRALAERALWWPAQSLLVVSDLHLGKAERHARRSGGLLPPYEADETLNRLEELAGRLSPAHILCLGDSFDDAEAVRALPDTVRLRFARLMAGRRWTWILGNHDPGPVDLGGVHRDEVRIGGLLFRHIAQAAETAPEISGHYHPKAGLRGLRRPAFVTDGQRLILPAFGTYTGGLDAGDPAIAGLMGPGARALLTGRTMAALPLTACARPRSGPPTGWTRGFG